MIALSCVAQATWWPTILVAVLIGVGIGMGMANWFYRARVMDYEDSVARSRSMHPSMYRGDGGGRGEMWEDG